MNAVVLNLWLMDWVCQGAMSSGSQTSLWVQKLGSGGVVVAAINTATTPLLLNFLDPWGALRAGWHGPPTPDWADAWGHSVASFSMWGWTSVPDHTWVLTLCADPMLDLALWPVPYHSSGPWEWEVEHNCTNAIPTLGLEGHQHLVEKMQRKRLNQLEAYTETSLCNSQVVCEASSPCAPIHTYIQNQFHKH